MPVPISASVALKMQSPRKNFGAAAKSVPVPPGFGRCLSPAPDGRPRANSVKRKEPEGPSFAFVASKNIANSGVLESDTMSDLTLNVVKVRSLLDKASTELDDVADPAVKTVLGTMCDAMREICTVQDTLVTGKIQSEKMLPQDGISLTNLGAIPKRPRNDTGFTDRPQGIVAGTDTVTGTGAATDGRRPVMPEEPDPVKKKFREAIKEAEKSTLIFNLNLGKVPILNRETMNKRATLALASLAAAKEKKTVSAPDNDTVEAIDDALSVAHNVTFFGNGTKTYKNPKDPLSGSYCTAPVKYDFEDKEVRFTAEKVLRDKCGINCAVPYPTMVRECMKQIVNEVKQVHPDNFVRVNVDTNKLVFKVARKPPKGDPDPRWKYDVKDVPIPVEAMNVTIRQVPKDFKITVPVNVTAPAPATPRVNIDTPSVEMTDTEVNE
jgi:hypothetical protein